jgi:gentisate 1,2-dioxygenase
MGARLEPQEGHKPVRHTGSVIYQVATGRGWSEVGGEDSVGGEGHLLRTVDALPARRARRAVLFSFHDFPVMKALGLFKEEQ